MKICKSGLHSYQGDRCYECKKILMASAKNKAKVRAKANLPKNKAKAKAKRLTLKNKTIARNRHLKKKYNITIDDYNKMFTDQQGCCAICYKHQTNLDKTLVVDHCHITGAVRGLLCNNCNLAIGLLGDNTEIINTAYNYLKNVTVLI